MRTLFLFLLFTSVIISQEMITVTGDSLVGITVNGEMMREVYGNVHLTQGDLVITCNKAIHYITKNNAELIGNVVVKQKTLTITTPLGLYYGNEKIAESHTGLRLDDKKVILVSNEGKYFFDEAKADFYNNVRLYDSTTTLTSNKLIYYRKEARMISTGDVNVFSSTSSIFADSLEYFRDLKVSNAFYNVKLLSKENLLEIYGDHLEDYALKSYSYIDKNPLLIQYDTSYVRQIDTIKNDTTLVMKLDTLVIKSAFMEAFRDTMNIFIAKDSVSIVRDNFSSYNDFTIFYKNDDKIITSKSPVEGSKQPILWYETSQLTGDSIIIFLDENRIKQLEVNYNSFLLSSNPLYKNRFDQISGNKLLIDFDTTGLRKTSVFGDVLSIYYMYEKDEVNGLAKSSSGRAEINFLNKQATEVKLYISPMSEFYPENQVEGKEDSFLLPQYIKYENKPVKEQLLEMTRKWNHRL